MRAGERSEYPALTAEFLARFEPVGALGEGSMGRVMECEDRRLGRSVAVKFLHARSLPATRQRFLREGRLMARVTHPNVVRVLDAGTMGEHPYLVCAYVDGRTLEAVRDSAPRHDVRRAVRFALDVLEGLAACHAEGIVHRDLKPANILVDAEGRALVADFGLARLIEQDDGLTATGMLVGTPAYMSPEQFRAQEALPASDVYACGVILYELISGARPFRTRELVELAARVANEPAPPLHTRVTDVPAWLSHLVDRMLSREPAARPTAAAAARELHAGLARTNSRKIRVSVSKPAPAPPRTAGRLGVLMGALAALALLSFAPPRRAHAEQIVPNPDAGAVYARRAARMLARDLLEDLARSGARRRGLEHVAGVFETLP